MKSSIFQKRTNSIITLCIIFLYSIIVFRLNYKLKKDKIKKKQKVAKIKLEEKVNEKEEIKLEEEIEKKGAIPIFIFKEYFEKIKKSNKNYKKLQEAKFEDFTMCMTKDEVNDKNKNRMYFVLLSFWVVIDKEKYFYICKNHDNILNHKNRKHISIFKLIPSKFTQNPSTIKLELLKED